MKRPLAIIAILFLLVTAVSAQTIEGQNLPNFPGDYSAYFSYSAIYTDQANGVVEYVFSVSAYGYDVCGLDTIMTDTNANMTNLEEFSAPVRDQADWIVASAQGSFTLTQHQQDWLARNGSDPQLLLSAFCTDLMQFGELSNRQSPHGPSHCHVNDVLGIWSSQTLEVVNASNTQVVVDEISALGKTEEGGSLVELQVHQPNLTPGNTYVVLANQEPIMVFQYTWLPGAEDPGPFQRCTIYFLGDTLEVIQETFPNTWTEIGLQFTDSELADLQQAYPELFN